MKTEELEKLSTAALCDEIEGLDLRLESQSSLPPSKIEQVAALLRECKAKLYDLDPTIERVEYGEFFLAWLEVKRIIRESFLLLITEWLSGILP